MARKRYGRSYLDWLGADIQRRVEGSSIRAIDRTTGAAAEYARSNHPGWISRSTGEESAEESIGTNPARKQKRRIRGNVTGGAGWAFHLLILEVKNGSALRNAADVVFPSVAQNLENEYVKSGVTG